jgi:hypothetical protein
MHPSGVRYDWNAGATPDHIELPDLPAWLRILPEARAPLLRALESPDIPDPRPEAWQKETLTWDGEEYGLSALEERAKAYIESMPASVSGAGGHEVAFRVAVALVRGFLLPEQSARTLYKLWNQQHAQPKWGVGELEHKLSEAGTRVKSGKWAWGYLIKGWPEWPDASQIKDEKKNDEDEGDDQPRQRTIEPRMVYIAAHDKFMWFPEGTEKPGLTEWQSFFSENGARGILQKDGYGFKKASVYVKEKRCHIVKDFSGRVPTNERIVKGPDGQSYLNLPQHLIPDALPGEHPLLSELFKSISGNDPESEEWLWNWAAYVTQRPNDLPGVCVVVRGLEGIGKSKLGEAIGYCRGAYVAVGNAIFREQFNSKWSDAHFVAAAEVLLADSRKEHSDRFKAWITDPFIEYHKKNVPEFNIPNRIAWWLSSNNDNPVVVPRGDRRFTILESVAPPQDVKAALIAAWSQYDRREHEWPELQHLRHTLLHRTVDVRKARNPLHNAVHDEHEEANKSSVEMFVSVLKDSGWLPLASKYGIQGTTYRGEDIKPSQIGVDGSFLYKVYALWAKEHGLGVYGFMRFANASVLRTTFHKLPQRRIRGIHYRLWVVPIGVDPDEEAS